MWRVVKDARSGRYITVIHIYPSQCMSVHAPPWYIWCIICLAHQLMNYLLNFNMASWLCLFPRPKVYIQLLPCLWHFWLFIFVSEVTDPIKGLWGKYEKEWNHNQKLENSVILDVSSPASLYLLISFTCLWKWSLFMCCITIHSI